MCEWDSKVKRTDIILGKEFLGQALWRWNNPHLEHHEWWRGQTRLYKRLFLLGRLIVRESWLLEQDVKQASGYVSLRLTIRSIYDGTWPTFAQERRLKLWGWLKSGRKIQTRSGPWGRFSKSLWDVWELSSSRLKFLMNWKAWSLHLPFKLLSHLLLEIQFKNILDLKILERKAELGC